jgi:hypothetical protein
MVEANIWGTFQQAGFEFEVGAEPYRLRFGDDKSRASPAFREIWSLDFPVEKLSVRRRNARFGWINKSDCEL